MPTVPAVSAAARTAGWLGHARHSLAAALGEETREFALGMLPAADGARDGFIRLAHRAQGFGHFFAFFAHILINWHRSPRSFIGHG